MNVKLALSGSVTPTSAGAKVTVWPSISVSAALAEDRGIVERVIADRGRQRVRVQRTVIGGNIERRRDLIAIINELDQATSKLSAGERSDRRSGGGTKLEESAGDRTGGKCEAYIVRVGDADVSWSQGHRLTLSERQAGAARAPVDRSPASS